MLDCLKGAAANRRVGKALQLIRTDPPDRDDYVYTTLDGTVVVIDVDGIAHEGDGLTDYHCTGLDVQQSPLSMCWRVVGTNCQLYAKCC